jgi:hypothetical protein
MLFRRLYLSGLSGLFAAALATSAGAASLQIDAFDRSDLAAARTAMQAFTAAPQAGRTINASRTEDFESFSAWNGKTGATDPVTAVGRFVAAGGTGHAGDTINGGKSLQVRNDNPLRSTRYDTNGGSNWLDSNDTLGMNWEVGGLPKFNAIAFLLTDVADQGARFSLDVGGSLFGSIGDGSRFADGGLYLVRVLLPETVSSLSIAMLNDKLNDGFGIDEAMVAQIAPVPVPPAALLMLTGVAGIAALRRRRAARPA